MNYFQFVDLVEYLNNQTCSEWAHVMGVDKV